MDILSPNQGKPEYWFVKIPTGLWFPVEGKIGHFWELAVPLA